MPENTTEEIHATKESNDNHSNLELVRLFKEINKKITDGGDFDLIFEFIFNALGILIPFDRIAISLLEDNRQTLRQAWVKSKYPATFLKVGFSLPIASSKGLSEIIKTRLPRIIGDLTQYFAEHPESIATQLIIKDHIRSSLTCPLISEGNVIGLIFFSSQLPFQYDSTHLESFESVASEISMLVEFSRLHRLAYEHEDKEKTLRTIIHDLRSPLCIIRGFIEDISGESWFGQLDEDSQKLFHILQKNTDFMLTLVDELAEVNRLKDRTKQLIFEATILRDFCAQLVPQFEQLAKRKGISLVMRLDESLPQTIRIDQTKIRQVFENLVSNAIKFSWPGSEIRIAGEQINSEVHFTVEDEGQGIQKDEMEKLFHEFGRTSTRPTGDEPSSGLGLAIARRVVEAHGGKIWATSEWNVSSIFHFTLPLSPETAHWH
jgi:signal transduction histidine kinase